VGTPVLGCANDYANVRQTAQDLEALRLLGINQLDPVFHQRYGAWAMIGEAGANGTALQLATDPMGVAEVEATVPCSSSLLEKRPPRVHQLKQMQRCPVINISSDGTELDCRAPDLPAGTASVYMRVQSAGVAQGSAKVRYNLSFESIMPSIGSRGGSAVTITGRGFHPSMVAYLQNSNWAKRHDSDNSVWWSGDDDHWYYEQVGRSKCSSCCRSKCSSCCRSKCSSCCRPTQFPAVPGFSHLLSLSLMYRLIISHTLSALGFDPPSSTSTRSTVRQV
jgi:hypothetical protein